MKTMAKKGKEREVESDGREVSQLPTRVRDLYNMHQREYEEYMYGKTADTLAEGDEEGF